MTAGGCWWWLAWQIASCQLLVHSERFGWIVTGGVALATFSAVAGPTRQALLPAMVRRDDLPKASAIGQTASSVGMMTGPALAGFLVGAGDVRTTLQIASFAFVATITAGFLLRTRRGVKQADAPAAPAVTWTLGQDRMFWAVVWGMALVVGAISAVNVVAVFLIRGDMGSTATMYGVVDATWTAGMLGGAWLLARMLRPVTTDAAMARWMFLSLGVISLLVMAVGMAPSVLWVVPAYLLGGALNGGENVIMGTLMGRRAPAEARGRAATAIQARVNGGALLGYVAGGLMLEIVTPRVVFIGAGGLGLLAVFGIWPLVRRASQKLVEEASQKVPAPKPARAVAVV